MSIFKNLVNVFLSLVFLVSLSSCKIYQSMGSSFGAYPFKAKGPEYVKLEQTYPDKALVYIYRPYSEWSSYEFEAPSFYVNDDRVFNIKGNSYTWLLLTPGEYDITMRRPLGGFEGIRVTDLEVNLKKILDFTFKAEAGKVYFMRYHELVAPQLDDDFYYLPSGDGPLQFVSESIANEDINGTHLMKKNGMQLEPKMIEVATAE